MKKSFLIAGVLCVLFFASCKKDDAVGNLQIKDKEEVYILVYDVNDNAYLKKYDSKTGEFVKQEGDFSNFETYEPYGDIITLNNTLYYYGSSGAGEKGVVKYDLKTNQAYFIRTKEGSTQIGTVLVYNKLHVITFDKTAGYEIVEISDNGDEKLVKKFGNINIEDEVSLYCNFIYDKATNSIFSGGDYSNSVSKHHFVASFSLESGEIKISDDKIDGEELFFVGSKLYSANGSDVNFEENTDTKTFFEINTTTLQKVAVVGEIEEFTNIGIYSESLNAVFLDVFKEDNQTIHTQATIYDIPTKTTRELTLGIKGCIKGYLIMQLSENAGVEGDIY